MVFKITPKRLKALEYAAGLHDNFPTYSVALALQTAGYLMWRGFVKGVHSANEKFTINNRGWELTEKGIEELKTFIG